MNIELNKLAKHINSLNHKWWHDKDGNPIGGHDHH